MRAWGVTHASGTPTFWRFLLVEMRGDGGPGAAAPPGHDGRRGRPRRAAGAGAGARSPRPTSPRSTPRPSSARRSRSATASPDFRPACSTRTRDLAFKVVDDELWVRSRAAMLGYYGEEPVDHRRVARHGRPRRDRRRPGRVPWTQDRGHQRRRRQGPPAADRGPHQPGARGRPRARVRSSQRAWSAPSSRSRSSLAPGYDPDAVDAPIRAACADLPPAARAAQHPLRRDLRHDRQQDQQRCSAMSEDHRTSRRHHGRKPRSRCRHRPVATSTRATGSRPAPARVPTRSTAGRTIPALEGRFLFREVDLSNRDQTASFVKDVVDTWGRHRRPGQQRRCRPRRHPRPGHRRRHRHRDRPQPQGHARRSPSWCPAGCSPAGRAASSTSRRSWASRATAASRSTARPRLRWTA